MSEQRPTEQVLYRSPHQDHRHSWRITGYCTTRGGLRKAWLGCCKCKAWKGRYI